MRVLHLVESWRPVISGYTSRGWEIVAAQARQPDIEPVVLVSSRQMTYGETRVQAPPGVTVISADPSRPEKLVRRVYPHFVDARHLAAHLDRVCEAHAIEIIHSHWASSIGWQASQVARRRGLPFVAEVRFDLAGAVMTETVRLSLPLLERGLRHWFERHLPHADAITAASFSLADLIRQAFPALADTIQVMPNGIDTKRFSPNGDNRRAALGLAERPVIGSTSKMLTYEGLERLIQILPRLRESVPGVSLLFVGDGPQRAALQKQASRAGLPVIFTGQVPPGEVPAYLRTMDIFAVPRLSTTVTRYASPIKVIEAMACGVPVVASAVGDIPHLLADNRGVTVPAESDDVLLNTLVQLLHDESRRRQIAERAADRAMTYLNWDALAEQYAGVYRDCL